jgi:hypothetical protein
MRWNVPSRAPSIILLIIGLFLVGAALPAQQSDAELGRQKGTADARASKDARGLGIILPGMSLFMPWVLPVPVPQNTLLGRSPEYLESYLDAYKARVFLHYLSLVAGGTLAVVGCVEAQKAVAEATVGAAELCFALSYEDCTGGGCVLPWP